MYEALAEYNIFKILYEASAEYNISKIARHTSLEVTDNNIVRGFSKVQYCWQSLQAECGVLFWSYCTRRELTTCYMDFIDVLGNIRKSRFSAVLVLVLSAIQ